MHGVWMHALSYRCVIHVNTHQQEVMHFSLWPFSRRNSIEQSNPAELRHHAITMKSIDAVEPGKPESGNEFIDVSLRKLSYAEIASSERGNDLKEVPEQKVSVPRTKSKSRRFKPRRKSHDAPVEIDEYSSRKKCSKKKQREWSLRR